MKKIEPHITANLPVASVSCSPRQAALGRTAHWVEINNPKASAVTHEAITLITIIDAFRRSSAPVGRHGAERLLEVTANANEPRLSEVARACVIAFDVQPQMLRLRSLQFDRMILALNPSGGTRARLDDISGIGPGPRNCLRIAADPMVCNTRQH
jgi:hypothetical protein